MLSRREAMKLGTAGVSWAALPVCLSCKAVTTGGQGSGRPAKLTGLLHNEDCTNIFGYRDFQAGKCGETVDRYVDVLADAGVSVLMCNTNARKTNYSSEVWESFWDGYDPDGSDEQPMLTHVPPEQRARYRKLVGNMLTAHNDGVDYPARVIQRCRARGIMPWISIRMNDVHYNDNLQHPFHGAIWRKTELFRQGHPGYYACALDYAHAEVREHFRALIAETLERYDADGVELDFLREPYLFSKGKEQEGRVILTAWLRGIRALADASAKKCGHAVRLGVRVPSDPDTALGLGLDAPAWAKEGLVDLVVVAPRWATLEYAMPLRRWRELVGDRVTLAGGLEVLYRPSYSVPPRAVTTEEAAGAATAVLSEGADAVYLFNYFQDSHPGWPLPKYQSTLQSFASLERLLKNPRRHAVTFRDVTVPGEAYTSPLPASGTALAFELPLGPRPGAGWQVDVQVEVAVTAVEEGLPGVSLNGIAGEFIRDEAVKSGNRLVTSRFPVAALAGDKRDIVTVKAGGKAPVKVERVEVSIFSEK